jgi:hypothetical protein
LAQPTSALFFFPRVSPIISLSFLILSFYDQHDTTTPKQPLSLSRRSIKLGCTSKFQTFDSQARQSSWRQLQSTARAPGGDDWSNRIPDRHCFVCLDLPRILRGKAFEPYTLKTKPGAYLSLLPPKIAIPNHLHYRTIVVEGMEETALWEHFEKNPTLALNVRTLHIGAEQEAVRVPPGHERWPKGRTDVYRAEDVRKWESSFHLALQKMRRLRSFRWSCRRHILRQGDALWDVLNATCPDSIQAIDIEDGLHIVGDIVPEDGLNPNEPFTRDSKVCTRIYAPYELFSNPSFSVQLFDLGSQFVTDITLDLTTYDAERMNIPRLRELLEACPTLRYLSLSFSTYKTESEQAFESRVVLDSIFASTGTWADLRTLKLHGADISGVIMGDFFPRHPRLELLDFECDGLFDHAPPGSLPNLRVLHLHFLEELRRIADIGAPLLEILHAHTTPPDDVDAENTNSGEATETAETAETLACLLPTITTIYVYDEEDEASWQQDYVQSALPSSVRVAIAPGL